MIYTYMCLGARCFFYMCCMPNLMPSLPKPFCPNHKYVPQSAASRWRECLRPHRVAYGLMSFHPRKRWRISILKLCSSIVWERRKT